MSYIVFFLIRTYILYSQLARCCLCFLLFWRRMQWFPFVWKRNYPRHILLCIYNVLVRHVFFSKKTISCSMQNQSKHWHVDNFSCTYNIQLFSLYWMSFLREQFLVDSLEENNGNEERNFSQFDVVIVNYLFCFFFSCNLFVFRASLYCCLSTRRKEKMIIKFDWNIFLWIITIHYHKTIIMVKI